MELRQDGDRWVFDCEYGERMTPKSAGFRWDPSAKQWWTPSIDKAVALADFGSEETRQALNAVLAAREAAIAASRATDAEIDIPAPEGLEYMPFQRAGVAYCLPRQNALIGDDMGLGKTIQALGVINADPSIQHVLIICPASLRLNWKREAERWLVRTMTVGIVDGSFPKTNVVILNYDILHKYPKTLRSREWDLMICDECHYLKNGKTNRTKAVFGYKTKESVLEPIPARRRLFLTGTPILNRPIELWPMLRAAGLVTSWKYFVTRYCGGSRGRFGWDVSGATNLSELQELLREKFMIRRLKVDVLTELPAKRRQVIEIPANGCESYVQAEQEAWEEQEARMTELQTTVELAKASEDPEEYKAAVRNLSQGMMASFTAIARLCHDTAMAKVPYVIQHLRECLETEDKVVVFAHHHDVVNALAAEFGSAAVVLTGETKLEDRQRAVDRFQRDPHVRVFIGSITAAGVGLTLTAASHVVFAELDWVPANISQAEDRCHRIGQTESVLVQHLVLSGSIDCRMAQEIVEKQSVIDKALDGQIEKEPITPVVVATKSVTRKEIEKEAESITPQEILLVQADLQVLAGMCDGAVELDGMGFNKWDAPLGHRLAALPMLTDRQAVLARTMLRKYKGQLGHE